MPLLVTVLGSCLMAASAAVSADRPANSGPEAWWSNPPTAASTASGAKTPEYGSAVAAGSGSNTVEFPTLGHTGPSGEFAPDAPGVRPPQTLSANYQEDSTPPRQ